MTDEEKILSIMPALAKLNAWARLPIQKQLDMSGLASQIYRWKRSAISAAMKTGLATQRIIAVERPCKACRGTGTYTWIDWNDEDHVDYQPCRRCLSTGKVILRFVESTIAGRTKFHTPRPKWDLGVFTELDFEATMPSQTDWTPEQPGLELDRVELIQSINQIESVICDRGLKQLNESYSLHLGMSPGCWICGSINCRFDYGIWRPIGLRWKSAICDDCDRTDAWLSVKPTWPVNLHRLRSEKDLYPGWHDRVPLPFLASDPAVVEWLARRQIFPGRYPPGDLAWTANGDMVRVLQTKPIDYEVEVVDRYGWTGTWEGQSCREYIGWMHGAQITLRDLYPMRQNEFMLASDPMAEAAL